MFKTGNKWELLPHSDWFDKRTFLTASLFLDDKHVTRTPSQIANSTSGSDSYTATIKVPKVNISVSHHFYVITAFHLLYSHLYLPFSFLF
jgi:hypothetical protein